MAARFDSTHGPTIRLVHAISPHVAAGLVFGEGATPARGLIGPPRTHRAFSAAAMGKSTTRPVLQADISRGAGFDPLLSLKDASPIHGCPQSAFWAAWKGRHG